MYFRVAATSWEEATGEPARDMEEGWMELEEGWREVEEGWREVDDCFLRRSRGSPLEEALLEGLGRRRRKNFRQTCCTREKICHLQ